MVYPSPPAPVLEARRLLPRGLHSARTDVLPGSVSSSELRLEPKTILDRVLSPAADAWRPAASIPDIAQPGYSLGTEFHKSDKDSLARSTLPPKFVRNSYLAIRLYQNLAQIVNLVIDLRFIRDRASYLLPKKRDVLLPQSMNQSLHCRKTDVQF